MPGSKNASGLNNPINESQGGTNAQNFTQARINMSLARVYNSKTASYTALAADLNKFIRFSGAGPFSLNLTAAATLGSQWALTVRNDTTSDLSINPNGAELINGLALLELEPSASVNIFCSGTAFFTEGLVTAVGADRALSNLANVAINASLLPTADLAVDLGTPALRWNNLYTQNISTSETAAQTTVIGAFDVDDALFTPFITLTANNTATCALASAVTSVTQAVSDNSTKIATTAYADAAAAAGGANIQLSNLGATSINANLIPSADVTRNFGSPSKRWNNLYTQNISTSETAAATTVIGAWDVDGAALTPFITLTANNTPTCALASSVTAVTQAIADNSTKLATTAYADAAAGGGGANLTLSNLNATTINQSLIPNTDVTSNLGSPTKRWNNLYTQNISTAQTAAQTTVIGAWDVDGASLTPFITLTANNTPTCALASSVTAVTQAASDNSTKLATTAYADTAAGGANIQLSNLGTTSINANLIPSADVTRNFGSPTKRWNNLYTQNISTSETAAATTVIGAWDVDGASLTPFITLTANNTPTCALASSVTAVTQAASNNSLLIASTAYVDNQVTLIGANRALSNLSAVSINQSLVPNSDLTSNLGAPTKRWNNLYAQNISTAQTAAQTTVIGAWDVDGAVLTPFITLTANNTPTCALASSVTAVTQAVADNSTKLATTAYADAAASLGASIGKIYPITFGGFSN